MTDQDRIRLLQWALPRLRLRWPGFRKVRKQVCRRISSRMRELDLPDAAAYRSFLEAHPAEWPLLDSLCRITISRFFRDERVFRFLEQDVLPVLARDIVDRGGHELKCWSIGCASGEEPYTLTILWDAVLNSRFPGVTFKIVATDAHRGMIERGKEGCYSGGSLRELPAEWVSRSFSASAGKYCISDDIKERVTFLRQDIRTSAPEGRFHLVLCRNSVFTYFDEALQREMLGRIAAKLHPGGALILGVEAPCSKLQGIFDRQGNTIYSNRSLTPQQDFGELSRAATGNALAPRFMSRFPAG